MQILEVAKVYHHILQWSVDMYATIIMLHGAALGRRENSMHFLRYHSYAANSLRTSFIEVQIFLQSS